MKVRSTPRLKSLNFDKELLINNVDIGVIC